MNFEYTWVLAILPIVMIRTIAFYIFSEARRRTAINRWIAPHMRSVLLQNFSAGRRYIKWVMIIIAAVLILCALARPRWDYEWQEHKAEGAEVLFIIDTSKSMLAEDIKPNRMMRAKMVVLDFLDAVKASRVGIIAFAGEAFLQCPLTLDYDAFKLSLEEIEAVIYQGGTNIEMALNLAKATFNGPSEGRNIGFGDAAFPAATVSAAGTAASAFAARDFLRRGLVCLATLSHSARSSSLRPRLRRGEAGDSGIGVEGRFIGRGDSAGWSAGGAGRGPAPCRGGLAAVVPPADLPKPARRSSAPP